MAHDEDLSVSSKSFMESYLDKLKIPSSPGTPTLVLPVFSSLKPAEHCSIVKAIKKLSPIDVKRLSIHMYSHVARQASDTFNHKEEPKRDFDVIEDYVGLVDNGESNHDGVFRVKTEAMQPPLLLRSNDAAEDLQSTMVPTTPPPIVRGGNIITSVPPSSPESDSSTTKMSLPPPTPPMSTSHLGTPQAPPSPPPPPMRSSLRVLIPHQPPKLTSNSIKMPQPPPPPPPMSTSHLGAPQPPPPPPLRSSLHIVKPHQPPLPPTVMMTSNVTKSLPSSPPSLPILTSTRKLEGSNLDGKSLKRTSSKIGAASNCNGKQGMVDALAEMTKRSSYFVQIEEDFKTYANSIKEVKAALSSFQTINMDELIKFNKYVESHMEKLTAETQVLARFEDFPSKKLEGLRMAAALYAKLDAITTTLQNWKMEGLSVCRR
ncbi:hypothetical protein L1987_38481 [Smallanthus sonchifolius]|uniref:Uncharacterized protein n=1 Tax=Smallanthus sonchifolius TaxID=185202 RepID=A0ACB9HKM6_9ASTR|nr:hypothetical protein L1987_38481 [Smallanthus sonchifolius]